MDWNEHSVVSCPPPSACVSPSDPTLTVENVREVMAEVGNWRRVGIGLGVPESKLQKIRKQSSTVREKSLALGDYWVNTAPDASWEKLAQVFYRKGEEKAAAVMKQYLPQGMCVLSCLLWKLWASKIVIW